MKTFIFAAAALVFSAQTALALSCEFPGITDDYLRAKESEDRYIIVAGGITYPKDGIATETDEHGFPPQVTLISAKIDGVSLGAKRTETPFQHPLTIELQCIATWCGHISWQGQMDGLFFVKEVGGAYSLSVGPCDGGPYNNSEVNRRILQRCLNGGRCQPEN